MKNMMRRKLRNMTSESKIIGGIGLVTLAILVGALFVFSNGNEKSVTKKEVIAENGLHWHPKLSVTIENKKQEIPPNLGVSGEIHQELHTHAVDAKDGVVHMEMKGLVTKDETKLGNFFRIWGKEFAKDKIFDKTNNNERQVTMNVNGKENKTAN